MRIEDYALVGDMQSAALISTAGAVDPASGAVATSRRYRPATLVPRRHYTLGFLPEADGIPAEGLRIAALT